MSIQKIIFGVLSIFGPFLAFLFVQRSRNPECTSFVPLGNQRSFHQPEELAERMISQLGGLPRADMDIHEALELLEFDASLPVYPVQEWHILTSSAANPGNDIASFFDSESMYNLSFRMQVMYADGDEATLQWSSWRYGFVACPFIISTGTGPPGYLAVVP